MDDYPHIWPKGGLFGFSGIDGDTRPSGMFLATGREDGIGWNFCLDTRPRVLACVNTRRLEARNVRGDYVFSDCWRCSVMHKGEAGVVEGAFVDHSTMAVAISFNDLPDGDTPDLVPVGDGVTKGDVTVFGNETWWLAIVKGPQNNVRRFGMAISYSSRDNAVNRARAAIEMDLPEVMTKRLKFYRDLRVPESVVDTKRRCYYKAASIQKVSMESPHGQFPGLWPTSHRVHQRELVQLDTIFHILGLSEVRKDFAVDALRALFVRQGKDGRIPRTCGPNAKSIDDGLAHPPLVGWAVESCLLDNLERDSLKSLYKNIAAYATWLEKNRRNDNGLFGWKINEKDDPVGGARGAEAAMDNSPRFDKVSSMSAVDLSAYMACEYRALRTMAKRLDRPREARRWRDAYERIKDKVNALMWDTEDSSYYDLDEYGDFIAVRSTAGFLPLLAEIPDRDQAEALRQHVLHPGEFWLPFPIPSVARDEKSYSKDMWRGATWPTLNVLIFHGLKQYNFYEEAHEVANQTLNSIAHWYTRSGCFFEFYDPAAETVPSELPRRGGVGEAGGAGYGALSDAHTTAAAYIHLIHQLARPS